MNGCDRIFHSSVGEELGCGVRRPGSTVVSVQNESLAKVPISGRALSGTSAASASITGHRVERPNEPPPPPYPPSHRFEYTTFQAYTLPHSFKELESSTPHSESTFEPISALAECELGTANVRFRHPMPRRLPSGVVHNACQAPSAPTCAVRSRSGDVLLGLDLLPLRSGAECIQCRSRVREPKTDVALIQGDFGLERKVRSENWAQHAPRGFAVVDEIFHLSGHEHGARVAAKQLAVSSEMSHNVLPSLLFSPAGSATTVPLSALHGTYATVLLPLDFPFKSMEWCTTERELLKWNATEYRLSTRGLRLSARTTTDRQVIAQLSGRGVSTVIRNYVLNALVLLYQDRAETPLDRARSEFLFKIVRIALSTDKRLGYRQRQSADQLTQNCDFARTRNGIASVNNARHVVMITLVLFTRRTASRMLFSPVFYFWCCKRNSNSRSFVVVLPPPKRTETLMDKIASKEVLLERTHDAVKSIFGIVSGSSSKLNKSDINSVASFEQDILAVVAALNLRWQKPNLRLLNRNQETIKPSSNRLLVEQEDNIKTADDPKTILQNAIDPTTMQIQVSKVRRVGRAGVVVQTTFTESAEKIKNTVLPTLQVKEPRSKKPLMTLRNMLGN
ncbi:hypothetical protein EVAR_45760_1 [Eumeta japonica]|uniref:Uncharacterized protein n=1 Tax=Eumeta variegata TaxID=151549 RepID=A0A4C1YT45_EUMVA|nr:hypothetical protein EVAR_45760_1 [Eumeta japonica]